MQNAVSWAESVPFGNDFAGSFRSPERFAPSNTPHVEVNTRAVTVYTNSLFKGNRFIRVEREGMGRLAPQLEARAKAYSALSLSLSYVITTPPTLLVLAYTTPFHSIYLKVVEHVPPLLFLPHGAIVVPVASILHRPQITFGVGGQGDTNHLISCLGTRRHKG